MTRTKKALQDLLAEAARFDGNGVQLFLISREIKAGYRRNAQVVGKYTYAFHEIRLNDELRGDFYGITSAQLHKHLAREDVEVAEYEPIDDDAEKVLTFSMKKKALEFVDIARQELFRDVGSRVVSNLNGLVDRVWAYAVVLRRGNEEPMVAFRKMPKTKVCVESGTQDGPISKAFLTVFKPGRAMLEKLNGTTLGFDTRIDCLLYGDIFYIFSKGGFERIAGLEEEFLKHANESVETLGATELVDGLDHLREAIAKSPNVSKRLARLSEDPRLHTLSKGQIKKMADFAAKFKHRLKLSKEGKIVLEDKDDVDLLIKLLNDYFLKSDLTGNLYGSFAKRAIV